MILGDMFELGNESSEEHKNIINLALPNQSITTLFVGENFYDQKMEVSNMLFFKNFDEFSIYLKNNLPENSIILIKGSRGMSLERTLVII